MKQNKDSNRGILAIVAVAVALLWIGMFASRQPPAHKLHRNVPRSIPVRPVPRAVTPVPPVPVVPRPVPVPPVPPAVPGSKGSISIVLDDWGYNLNNVPMLEQISAPVTLAVLPNLPYSEIVAARAHASGKEVILHFPMEPFERMHWERNTVLTTMSPAQIRSILAADLANLKYAQGISNHQGSKATGDVRVMSTIMKELHRRRMFFLDSYVTSKSVVSAEAGQEGVDSVSRDVFLDNQSDPQYIRGQIAKLKKKAALSGRAIGIGHDRVNTLLVLREAIPEMISEGYAIVPLTELIAEKKKKADGKR